MDNEIQKQKAINRITKMEGFLDDILLALKTNPMSIKQNPELIKKLYYLEKYYTSGKWLSDYQKDEKGEFPKDLKRGVLSQDTLYDLFQTLEQL